MKQLLSLHILIVIITIQVLTTSVCGQNLVLNPSMEDTLSCPVIVPNFSFLRANYWHCPTAGSSDYFNTSTNCLWGGGVPQNVFGFQFPKTLESYLGFSIHNGPPLTGYREYVTGTLMDSLEAGKKYCVSFYVSAANKCKYVTDDIGVYFCNDTSTITDYTTNQVLNFVPQIENIQGNILGDTLNWMLISGEFIAQGGEKFLTIGNFKDYANTTLDTIQGAIHDFGYYYIDDVSVIDCTVGINELQSEIIGVDIFPNPCIDELNIKIKKIINSKLNITIYDSLGKQVFAYNTVIDQNIKINTSKFNSGLYFLRIWSDQGNSTRRFVKL